MPTRFATSMDGLVAAAPPHPELLRRTMAQFPTGVCVLTTTFNGVDCAMTANSVTSVSLTPPLILACVRRNSRFQKALTTSEYWAVSILDDSSQEIASQLARSAPLDEQFRGVATHRGECCGMLLIDRSVATVECVTTAVFEAGDHLIYLGQVLSAATGDEAASPLLYHRSAFLPQRPTAPAGRSPLSLVPDEPAGS